MNRNLKLLITATVSLVVGIVMYAWVSSHGYIKVSITGSGATNLTYSFTDGKSGKVTEIKTASQNIRRLVPKGDYTVSVTGGDKNAILLIHSQGFLRTTERSRQLDSEKARTFIGNQPNTCMYYMEFLYSFDCGDEYSTLKMHVPATENEPTYTKNAEDIPVPIKGIVTVKNQPYLITQSSDEIDDGKLAPVAQPLKPDLAFSAALELKALRGDELYSFQNYKSGFIAYDNSFRDVKYFTDFNSQPQPVNIARPSDKNVKPANLSILGDRIGVFFSERQSGFEVEGDEDSNQKNKLTSGKSEFILYDGTNSRNYTFDTLYVKGTLCGTTRLCLTADDKLDIFDISGPKATLLFAMKDVKDVKYIDQKLTIVTSKQIISLSDDLTGSALYSFGGYTYCGLSNFNDRPVICAGIGNNQKYALLIDTTQTNDDSIDKKMLSLSKIPRVEFVSPYKNYIYVAQETGDKKYNSQLKGFYYDQNEINKASGQIQKQINELGVNRNKYQVKFILAN